MRGVTIKMDDKIKVKKEMLEFIKPQKIYIPLENKSGIKYKKLVNVGDYVFKGQVVAMNESIDFPIHSSVSGYVVENESNELNTGKKVECIAIENDFKEKYQEKLGSIKEITNYSKEEFIELLKTSGITGLGGSDFPTFLKYNTESKINYLLVNGVECEPYISCDKVVMSKYMEKILEAVDAILEIMKIKKAYIVVKSSNIESQKVINKYINTYPNIKLALMPDMYPAGWERNIVEVVLHKKYDKYPVEVGAIVSNVSTIYAIYEMLKYNTPLTERIITITGTGIRKPSNIKVKIGTKLSEIIENIEGYKDIKKPIFIAGGPMMGSSLPNDNLIVTKDLNCVLVIDDIELTNYPCIKCGKCTNVCPVHLLPVMIMNNMGNEKKLKELMPQKCIECGLCSYICPSKIEVREYVRIAKGRVNK
ncbi:MAG: RnfABCDGE type electron transport complex subunit C [Bacilli bacterium]|nr:RnfABCDGE type electron transport complex subunit C [Bacilli bacterium]